MAILDLDLVSAKFGKVDWLNEPQWYHAKQTPSLDAIPILVNHQLALIRAELGLSKKVLVLDLDNTLWGGIIGEDSIEGITLGAPYAVGEAYQAMHKYALELKERGILLAICSKNNKEDAIRPFLEHEACLLKLDDFVIFQANWRDKPSNLKEIAGILN